MTNKANKPTSRSLGPTFQYVIKLVAKRNIQNSTRLIFLRYCKIYSMPNKNKELHEVKKLD